VAVPTDNGLAERVRRLATGLGDAGQRLVTAESCTGGWIAKVCTDQPGSSAWFEEGLVTYSNAAKQARLAVPAETLARHGAVSAATAEAMARGAQAGIAGRVAVATTGVAGPGGGTADKPVGLVWFAWGLPAGQVVSEAVTFKGDRDAIRHQSVVHALDGLLMRFPTA
jgi:nicotinamide-nucleotide amidase